jgi:hypothetical protein
MRSKATGAVFKLDSDSLLTVARVSIRDAVRVGGADLLDAKLQAFRDL